MNVLESWETMMMNFYNRNLAAKKRTPFCSPPLARGGWGGQTRRHVRRTNCTQFDLPNWPLAEWRVDSETPLPPLPRGENSGLDQPGTLAIVRALRSRLESMRCAGRGLRCWEWGWQPWRGSCQSSNPRFTPPLCGKNISWPPQTIPGSVIRPSIPRSHGPGNLKKDNNVNEKFGGKGLNPSIGKGSAPASGGF